MIGRLAAAVALAAATLAAPAAGAQAPKRGPAAAAVDWTRRVAATPEGGFRMGNPAARVKLVEYGSMTCPTCAAFSSGAKAALAAKVRTGRVSFEFRPYILNGIDAAATLLTRCAGPGGFFRLTETLYSTQPQWVGRVTGLGEAQRGEIMALPEGQRLVRIAEVGGLLPVGAQAGIPAARARACIADPAGLERLGQIGEAAQALGVQGTPTFFVNGRMVHAHSWAELEPLLRQAGG
jgi:protein-disulfide isomerase